MEEIDITDLVNIIKKADLRDNFKRSLNINITFMPFFIKTFSLALKEVYFIFL
jgi:hypothetical protein